MFTFLESLDHWQAEKRRAIWFHVRTEHSEWVPYLTKVSDMLRDRQES